MKDKLIRLSSIIIIVLIIIITVFQYMSKNNNKKLYNENLFNIIRTSMQTVIQGDIVKYEFKNKSSEISNENIIVQIINPKDVVVGYATIKNNKIIIDTSFLSSGTYRIKIVYDSQEMIAKENFTVIIMPA